MHKKLYYFVLKHKVAVFITLLIIWLLLLSATVAVYSKFFRVEDPTTPEQIFATVNTSYNVLGEEISAEANQPTNPTSQPESRPQPTYTPPSVVVTPTEPEVPPTTAQPPATDPKQDRINAANDSQRKNDVATIVKLLEDFYNRNRKWPTTYKGRGTLPSVDTTTLMKYGANATSMDGVSGLPTDPTGLPYKVGILNSGQAIVGILLSDGSLYTGQTSVIFKIIFF